MRQAWIVMQSPKVRGVVSYTPLLPIPFLKRSLICNLQSSLAFQEPVGTYYTLRTLAGKAESAISIVSRVQWSMTELIF